jgi:hypothetical protein
VSVPRSRRRSYRPGVATLVLVTAALLVACTGDASPDEVPSETAEEPAATRDDPPPSGEDEPDTTPAEPAPDCRHDGLEDGRIVALTGDDPPALARDVASRTHRCTDVVVVAPAGWEALLAVPVAIAEDAPLLISGGDAAAELTEALDALGAERVVTVGVGSDGVRRPATELTVLQPAEPSATPAADGAADAEATPSAAAQVDLALAVADHLAVEQFVAFPADDPGAGAAAAAWDGDGAALLPVPSEEAALVALAEALPSAAEVRVVTTDGNDDPVDRLLAVGVDAEPLGPDDPWAGATTSWLVDPAQPGAVAVAAVAAHARGEGILPVDPTDLRSGADARRLREVAPERAVLVGDLTEDAAWQVATVVDGPTLPTGGHRLFEGERIVALYGHPGSTVLGALGEQDLDATVARAREVAAPYGADGAVVVPAFEIITTIASAEAGPRGDYSRRADPELIRPFIERAAEEGFHVVLDLQPGRTDFLEQAQEYEEFLREPHVGLALDPEWRLEDDQVHLQQIGSVAAEEVQRVVDWLAELTREHRLPQKLLVLHQFRFSMLPDRDMIEPRPELAIVIHMDGQGPIQTKYETYAAITAGAEDRWVWGWKNFYDEDDPTPTPDEVLALDPLPWFVSYQ